KIATCTIAIARLARPGPNCSPKTRFSPGATGVWSKPVASMATWLQRWTASEAAARCKVADSALWNLGPYAPEKLPTGERATALAEKRTKIKGVIFIQEIWDLWKTAVNSPYAETPNMCVSPSERNQKLA